jgi:hypothetical protein
MGSMACSTDGYEFSCCRRCPIAMLQNSWEDSKHKKTVLDSLLAIPTEGYGFSNDAKA